MAFASPADLSPIPKTEAPRDCPLCPRLVRLREVTTLVDTVAARLRRR